MQRSTAIWATILVAITLLAYVPAIRGGFIWDDDDYVTENPTLHDLAGLKSIWLDPSATPQYYPLVHSSFWIENHLWGLNPFGYHLVNVLIHAANALLLWRILTLLEVPAAWMIAMVFAVHPVHVESVAWITERKNVLSGLFYLLSALCFFRFSGFPQQAEQAKWKWYVLSLLFFIGALWSKTVAATFPAAMLVMIWWKQGRINVTAIVRLTPFFVLGISLGLLTVWLEKNQVGASGIDWELSFLQRCVIAGRALWFYAGKLLWPIPLIFNYHRWTIDTSQIWQFAFPGLALAVMIALYALRHRLGRGPLAAVLFFAGTLFPALGFFDVYPMRFSFVADHFQYLASIGVIALGIVAGKQLIDRLADNYSMTHGIAGGLVILLLFSLTWKQGYVYEGVETLWRDTISKNPTSFLAHNNLGAILNRRNEFAKAEHHLRQAVELKPDFPDSIVNLGKAREGQGDLSGALALYQQATRIKPSMAAAWNGVGAIQGMQGDLQSSEKALLRALQLDPQYAQTHSNLATLYASQGKLEAAVAGYRKAIELDESLLTARENLARVLMSLDRADESEQAWRQVVAIDSTNVSALLNLGILSAGKQRYRKAAEYFERVMMIDPMNAKAWYNAGAMYEQLGDRANADRCFGTYESMQPKTQ